MANEKTNTIEDFKQAVIDLGMSLAEDYNKGFVNENKLKAVDAIIKVYETLKVKNK